MPTYNAFNFEIRGKPQPAQQIPQPSPNLLAANGPVIQIQIETPPVLAESLQKASTPIPNPIEGFVLIDTGASITAIDVSIFTQLGINPNGIAMVGTAGGPQQQSTYPVRLTFPGTGIPGVNHAKALGCNLAGQLVLGTRPLIALIGRDILQRFILIYNGSAGMFSLSI